MLLPVGALARRGVQLQQIDIDALPVQNISNGSGGGASMSADGRYVAFSTFDELVPEDINGDRDIYIYDRETGALEFVGVPNLATEDFHVSSDAMLSADGQVIIFTSDAPDFVENDQNDSYDLFIYDRTDGSYSRANLTSDGAEVDGQPFNPVISPDGNYVAFHTWAQLTPDDVPDTQDVYVYDRSTGDLERIGGEGGRTHEASLSQNAEFIAFESAALTMVDGDLNEQPDIFVLTRATGEIERVSVASDGGEANDLSREPLISADGRYVLFESRATNLVPGIAGNELHIYLHDRQTGETELIDASADGAALALDGALGPTGPAISADGNQVVFTSLARLTDDDVNDANDVYLRDRAAGTTTLVSRSVFGLSGDGSSSGAVISADGAEIAFSSTSSNITYLDDDGFVPQGAPPDVFVRTMGQPYPPTPFEATHERTDLPVMTGQAQRTWTWAPEPFTEPFYEPYGQQSDGNVMPIQHRLVQYYDKARMEVTHPGDDPNSIWYVTNGLLVVEMMTGELQVSDETRLQLDAAQVNVAGDADDPNGPTYAGLAGLRDAAPHPSGAPITARVDRQGQVTTDPALADFGVEIALMDDVTGHGIAAPFWEFMNSSGTIWDGSGYVTDQLFENAYFATGRPLIEAYWAEVLVGGQPHDVLMQCFERRCLTYTPGNPEGFVVEAGNVGLHYYDWRYNTQPLAPDLAGSVVFTERVKLNIVDHGGVEEILTAPDGFEIFSPIWSPDGSQVAYVLWADASHADLYLVNADGSDIRQLTVDDDVSSPSWSPDGSQLVFESNEMITIMNVDGTGRADIGPGRQPAWSPLGDRIAYIERDDRVEHLTTMDVDGGNVNQVITAPFDSHGGYAYFSGYGWSPDGTQFAYAGTSTRPASPNIFYSLWTVNADGTDERIIDTGGAAGSNPGWSPDGGYLTYSREHVVYAVDPETSEVRGLLWDLSGLVRDYDWRAVS